MESGWYFDPDDESVRQKFWDGEVWTGETRRSPPSDFPMAVIRTVVSVGLGALAVILAVILGFVILRNIDQRIDPGIGLAVTAFVFVSVSWMSLFVWSKKASRKRSLSALLEQRNSGNIDEAGYQTLKDRILD